MLHKTSKICIVRILTAEFMLFSNFFIVKQATFYFEKAIFSPYSYFVHTTIYLLSSYYIQLYNYYI